VSPLPSDPGPGGVSCLCFRAGLWWVKFPSSTQRLPPLLGALRAPPGLRLLPRTPPSGVRIGRCPLPCPSCRCRSIPSGALGPRPCRCSGTWPTRQCRLAGLASRGPPSSRGRFGSLALPFAWATRPCVGRARTSRRVPPAGLRCAVSPSPRLRLLKHVLRPACGWGVSGSASPCVA
jgi:hypothetical protein